MNNPNDDHYHQWLHEKRSQRVPDRFTDDVMQAIADDSAATEHGSSRRYETFAFWAQAALFTLAVTIGVGRYGLLVLCLFFFN